MNKKGFTLIELLAVIVILAIIMAIAIPKIMNVIENSKKDSLVSGTKIISKAIQADSISTGKQYYQLTSAGILYRCNDGEGCTNKTQIKYNGELISSSGDSVIFVKNDDGSVQLSSGTICEKSKKYCFQGTEESPISLKSVSVDSIVTGSSITTTTTAGTTTTASTTTTTNSGERTIVKSGDITGSGPINSVTYVYYSDRTLEINGTGEGQMRDFDFIEGIPNSLLMQLNGELLLAAVEENLVEGMTLEQIPAELLTYLKLFHLVYGLYTVDDVAGYLYENSEEGTFELLEEAKAAVLEFLTPLFGENCEYVYNNLGIQNQYINSVIINEGVPNVGFGAFVGSLSYIKIADTVITIGSGPFIGSSSNLIVDLGEGVQTIGFAAFMMNKGLHSITIPASVIDISEIAFWQTGLTSITIEGNQTRFNEDWPSIGFPPELMPNY